MVRSFCLAVILSTSSVIAQTQATQPSSTSATQARAPAFDVVSIKPARPGQGWHFGFGPTGYSAVAPLSWVIHAAFFGSNMGGKDSVIGLPEWADKEMWEIETTVAAEDMAAYERDRANLDNPNPITRQMLQTMLADRAKLLVHRVPAQMDAFAIEVAKGGPKLTPAVPNEPQPSASVTLLGGGFVVPYNRGEAARIIYNSVSMSTFAHELRGMAGGPVLDRTDLTGKYDFTLSWLSLGPDEHEGFVEFGDPFPLSHWNFGALGLKVQRIQIPTEHIVIDHIEKPSAN